jgi:hypothetical protein
MVVMKWQERLRGMLLAGGALSASACVDNAAVTDAASAPFAGPCCNANGDPCCPILCDDPDAASAHDSCELQRSACEAEGGFFSFPNGDPASAASCSLPSNDFEAACCNANPDPCCTLGYCDSPDASAYAACEQQRSACVSDGGAYNLPFFADTPYANLPEASCSLPGEPAGDGGDGGDGSAGPDGTTHD